MMKGTTIMNRSGNLVTREQLIRSVASSSALSNGMTVEENEKMVIIGKLGNILDVGVLEWGECAEDLREVGCALLRTVEGLEKELTAAIHFIEESGVDWDDIDEHGVERS